MQPAYSCYLQGRVSQDSELLRQKDAEIVRLKETLNLACSESDASQEALMVTREERDKVGFQVCFEGLGI